MPWFALTWNPAVWTELPDEEWDRFATTGEPDLAVDTWSAGSR